MWSSSRNFSNAALSRKELFVQKLSSNESIILPTKSSRVGNRALNVPTKSSVLVSMVEISPPPVAPSASFDHLSVILTKRSSLLRSHRGEICFPGGRCDEGETFEETALRESWEEMGIEQKEFDVWARLEPVMTSKFDRSVMPIVAELRDPTVLSRLKPNCHEVEFVFSVPLSHLVTTLSHTLFVHPRFKYRLPLFHINQFTIHAQADYAFIPRSIRIWGLSAIILHVFLTRLALPNYDPFPVKFY